MNKKEFLEKLKNKISILNDDEIDDIINEYAGYIDEKVSDGKTEKEAVKELGNVNEIASDLLDAYKIKTNTEEKENIIEKAVNSIAKFVELIVNNIRGKSFGEILKFLIILGLIFLVILAFKVPFLIVESAGVNILEQFDNVFLRFISKLWVFVIECSYLFIAVVAFISIVKKEFLKDEVVVKPLKETKKDLKKEVPKTKKNVDEKVDVSNMPKRDFFDRLSSFIAKCIILFLKFICCWIMLGIFCYLVGVSVAFAIAIFIFLSTFNYFGIVVLLIGLLLIGISFADIGFNFIVNKKIGWKKIFITIISGIILLGTGIGFTSLSVADTKYKKLDNTSTKEVVYKMDDNILFKDFGKDYFVIDNNEKDIRIVYTYNKDFIRLKNVDEKDYHLNNYDYKINNRAIFKQVIKGLKNKTLYYFDDVVDLKVYTNEDNYKVIENNYNNWIKQYEEEHNDRYEDADCYCEIND